MQLINNIDPLFTSEKREQYRDRDEDVSREIKTGAGLIIDTVLTAYFAENGRNRRTSQQKKSNGSIGQEKA